MNKSSFALLAVVGMGLVGCTIRSYDDESGSGGTYYPGPSASATTTGVTPSEVAYLPNEATVGVVSDGTNAYVSTTRLDGTGRILRFGADGSTLTLAPSEATPHAMVSDEIFLYYTLTGGGIRRVKKAGGGLPEDVTTSAEKGANGLALSGDELFFTAADGVHQVSRTGGASSLLAADSGGADAIVADGNGVYWIDDAAGAVKRADLTSGAVTTLADGLRLSTLTTFALGADANNLYFPDPTTHRIYRLGKADGALALISDAVPAPVAITVDDTSIFVTSTDPTGGSNQGVYVASKSAGSAQLQIFTNVIGQGAYAVAVDSQSVWFTNDADSGSVYRASKSGWTWGNNATTTNGAQ